MTEMDALRLRVAVRAYRATKPSDGEVERGVRKTLSAMRRSQIRRRKSLMPAIIVAILAFGTLAYANPNNVRRWMSSMLLSTRQSISEQVAQHLGALRGSQPAVATAAAPALSVPAPSAPLAALAPEAPVDSPAAAEVSPAVEPAKASRSVSSKAPSAGRMEPATWAEVNSALGAQDTPRALAALGDLSRRGDPATRAKAQLGIAQLLWSRGDRGTACSIAQTLIRQKGTPQRVQERARTLAQGCGQ